MSPDTSGDKPLSAELLSLQADAAALAEVLGGMDLEEFMMEERRF